MSDARPREAAWCRPTAP